MEETRIAIFRGKNIRKTIYKREWWFVIEDVVLALIDSYDPKQYVKRMRLRDPELNKGWVQIVHTLPVKTSGGKQKMSCANTEGILRIVQSIPSSKAEPLKRWLARVGFERIEEIEDPELGMKRTRFLYKLKGYPDGWIEHRMRGIVIRDELTNEWQKRGAEHEMDYKILTAEISKATFNVTPSEYKNLKGLERQNLRDHMDELELLFTMLGEKSTSELHKARDTRGVKKLKKDAREGGGIAGRARRDFEKRTKRLVVTKQNFLPKGRD